MDNKTGDAIKAEGIGGHTGAVDFCLPHNSSDSRQVALRDYGWKRIEGLNIETWTLTHNDRQAIVNGLCSIYGNNVAYQLINVYVFATDKWYVQIPFDSLANKGRL